MSKIHLLKPLIYDNRAKIYDIKFNGETDQLGIVDISGKFKLLSVKENDKLKLVQKINVSDESIFSFDLCGQLYAFGLSNGDTVVLNGKKVVSRHKRESTAISKIKFIEENTIASGDGKGAIEIYDTRTKTAAFSFKEQEEDVSDFEYKQDMKYLLSTSIDGTLAVYDLRKSSLYALSDCVEDELTCMRLIKHKVACGTSEGPIVLFNWDWFGDYKDRIMGHPSGVNCMEKYDEDTLITGCEDGGIRFVTIAPKGIRSMICDKKNEITKNNKFNEITSLSMSQGKQFLAVCSNIDYVKLYNISGMDICCELNEDEQEEREDLNEGDDSYDDASDQSDSEESEEKDDPQAERNQSVGEEKIRINTEISLHESDESESNSSMSSSSVKKKKSKRVDKTLSLGKKRKSDYIIEKERRKDFFGDI